MARTIALAPGKFGLLLFITTVFYATQASIRPDIRMRVSTTALQQGDNFTAVCTVSSNNNASDYWPIAWRRVDCQGKIHQIIAVTNGTVDPIPLPDRDRYNASFKASNDRQTAGEFQLTINQMRLSETGTYGCTAHYAAGRASVLVWEMIAPATSIEGVILQKVSSTDQSITNLTNGQTLTVEKGSSYKFICLAVGGNPWPQIDVFIGDGKGGVLESLSRYFTHRTRTSGEVTCTEGPDGLTNVVHIPYKATKEGTVRMDNKWDGKPLVFTAKIVGVDVPVKIETANVTLKFKTNTASKLQWSYHMYMVIVALLWACKTAW